MSNQEGDLERSARRHPAAIWGIIAALVLAGLALLVFAPLGGSEDPPAPVTPDVTGVQTTPEAFTPSAITEETAPATTTAPAVTTTPAPAATTPAPAD